MATRFSKFREPLEWLIHVHIMYMYMYMYTGLTPS